MVGLGLAGGFNSGAAAGAERFVIIGVDGLSPAGVIKAATPSLDGMMTNGAYTLHARGVLPTSSSPNWASMIMGAGPEQHGVTSNDWETHKFEIPPLGRGTGTMFPTIFGVLRQQRPEAVIGCFHDWLGFGRLFERESANQVEHVKDAIETAAKAASYLKEKKPHFLFIHFDGVDHAGHAFGWTSWQYYKAVELADSLIGAVTSAIEAAGLAGSTAVLVTADHGGIGTTHGGATLAELEIPWILTGPGVRRGYEIKSPVNTYDTAATVAHVLGLRMPELWIARPVLDAFDR